MSDEVQPSRRLSFSCRTALYVVAWLTFLIALVGLVARFIPATNHSVLVVAALSPYLMVCASLSTFLLLLTHRWWTASAALMLAAVAVFVELPLFIGSNLVAVNSIPLRVLTANLHEGSADPKAFVAIARDVDLLIVEELTPELAGSLADYGLDSDFPYAALDPRPEAAGVGIWSRYPVVQSRLLADYQLGVMSAVIRPPHVADDVVVLGVHLTGPWPQRIDSWREEVAKLAETISELAASAGNGATIVAGDFNATFDIAQFRKLLRSNFSDAAAQSNAGFTPTYPADSAAPPFLAIDHILTHNSSATDAHTVRIPGSDHLGFIATVHVPS